MANHSDPKFVVCVRNKGYKSSLVIRKVYRAIPDAAPRAKGLLRVVDESGEDYLFPAEYFVSVSVSKQDKEVIAKAG